MVAREVATCESGPAATVLLPGRGSSEVEAGLCERLFQAVDYRVMRLDIRIEAARFLIVALRARLLETMILAFAVSAMGKAAPCLDALCG